MSGLPEEKREGIEISNNGSVTIKSLDTSQCSAMIHSIHGKKHFGKKLFCNGYVPLTPEKETIGESMTPVPGPGRSSSSGKSPSPSSTAATVSSVSDLSLINPFPHLSTPSSRSEIIGKADGYVAAGLVPDPDQVEVPQHISAGSKGGEGVHHEVLGEARGQQVQGEVDEEESHPAKASPENSEQVKANYSVDWNSKVGDWSEHTDHEFVRRYSLSLNNRTPPSNSVAADIMRTCKQHLPQQNLLGGSQVNSIKGMQEGLSDFNSCHSTLDQSSSEDTSDYLKTSSVSSNSVNKKKRKKKTSVISRDSFLKKQDTKLSPQ